MYEEPKNNHKSLKEKSFQTLHTDDQSDSGMYRQSKRKHELKCKCSMVNRTIKSAVYLKKQPSIFHFLLGCTVRQSGIKSSYAT